MSLSEEETVSKSETPEETTEQDDVGAIMKNLKI